MYIKWLDGWVLCALLAGSVLGFGCGEDDAGGSESSAILPNMPATGGATGMQPASETVATDIPGVIAEGAVVQVLAEGFMGTEGPLGLPDGSFVFTETNANRIRRFDENDELSTFLEDTNGSNALGIDPMGRMISVQTTPGMTRIGVIFPEDEVEVLTDSYDGQPYGRPNDLVVSASGAVYFTEPGPNAPADGSTPPAPPLPPAVYHIPGGGAAQRVAEGIRRPNGIMLSREEETLYVNDTQGEYLLAFDVQADGTLTNRRDFAAYDGVTRNDDGTVTSGADGLAIDSEGRLYVATPVGVQVFSAAGERLGTIPVSRPAQNIAFAGPNKQTLYIVGRGAAYKVAMQARGFAGRAK